MNKRRRGILSALDPVVAYAMSNQPAVRPLADVPGLAMRARVTAEAPAELMIYGRIGGGSWFEDGISASDVARILHEVGPGPLDVRINSGGGDAFDGVAIHSLISRHSGLTTGYVDGIAASAASFVMLACDTVKTSRNAMFMIHDAMTGVFGNRDSLMRKVELLDLASANIADIYAEKAGEDVEFWRAKMLENGEDGVWYTGQTALDAGLVDEIVGDDDESAESIDDYLAGWVNILPQEVAAGVSARALARESQEHEQHEQKETAVNWDRAALVNIMKEVLA
jgi:ATP-dependent protease ClpP protease subunit